jgi:phosphatidylethanolamine/phosphatidyl-N-methylethanolamine N-methyltransferase
VARVGREFEYGGAMTDEIDKQTMAKAYARWAPVYDLVFGAVFERGRKASIEAAERACPPGGRILDVGVGTGISLPDYSRANRIVAVDYSEPMLRKALERVIEHKLHNVEAVAVMDAKHLGFPDASFDVVVAQYVITAVPEPEATLDEFARVLRPGGEIVLVNHIGAETGLRRAFEQWFSPVARRLGWRPEFPWARLTRWAERVGGPMGIQLIERRPMPPLGHFSLIRFGKSPAVPVAARAGG